MRIQRRAFIQASAAAAVVAAVPVIAAELPPWQLGAIDEATRQIAGALNKVGIRTQALTQPADYLSKISGVVFDTEFYNNFKHSQQPAENRDNLYPVYLQPAAHSVTRGMLRTSRARVLNELATEAELELLIGGVADDYAAGHLKEIALNTTDYDTWVDSQIDIANCRYGVIEYYEQNGLSHVYLDRPLEAPLAKGKLVRGGLHNESVRFNEGVRIVSTPARELPSVTRNGVCASYKIDGDEIYISVLCGIVLDNLSKCSRYVGTGSPS